MDCRCSSRPGLHVRGARDCLYEGEAALQRLSPAQQQAAVAPFTRRDGKLNLRLPRATLERWRKRAAAADITLTELVEMAVERCILSDRARDVERLIEVAQFTVDASDEAERNVRLVELRNLALRLQKE